MIPTVNEQVDRARPRISVIVVSYNGRAYLERCLGSLLAEGATDHEVILVDSASADGSAAYVERAFPEVCVVRTTNGGYGHGCNVGARLAHGAYLAFLNQDTVVRPGWAEALVAALQHSPAGGLSTPCILLLREPSRANTCGNDVHCSGLTLCRGLGAPAGALGEDAEVGAISGAAFAVSKHLFVKLGGFDERFGMYMEDTDLSLRARLAGYRCLYVSGAVVYHDYRLRFGPRKTYYQERNRYLMLLKHLKWATLLAMLPVLLLGEVVTWGYVLLHEPHRVANKLRAYVWVAGHWKEIVADRQRVQAMRRATDWALLAAWTCRLAFEQAGEGSAVRAAHALFDPLFRASWRMAQALVWRWEVGHAGPC
jgi:GT2 family glycosyltransferase